MAEIVQEEGQKGKGKRKAKKHGTHIDMTPMVDLACLLLTFFMLTTAFNKPKVMEIILPEKPKENEKPPELDKSRALNILLIDNDKILWYDGLADPSKTLPVLTETDFSKDGIRKVLLMRNKELFAKVNRMNTDVKEGKLKIPRDTLEARTKHLYKEDKSGPIVLIKAADGVKYRNIVDIIDEMAISNVARYTLVDINPVEKMMVKSHKN
ncbi:MAG TPA: biopolymer transporter ExbD [Prolixibacteraceae bacterium]|jgi:biopolymer transport protein ExbD|nr:biopolymer transporter ExbD [Prolixibacteraceae bacterium]